MAFLFKERQKVLAGLRDVVDRAYYRIPDEFITINHHQASLLKRFVHGKEVHVIHLPLLNPWVSDQKACSPPSHSEGKLHIGIVGRIEFNQKNQEILIEVSNILRKRNNAFVFHIIGDGPDRKRLERAIDENRLKEHFVLYGWLDKRHISRLMSRKIDFMLIPSNYEGVPLVLLETVSLARPFLISNLDGLQEYALPEPFLIDPHNPEDIAAKILHMKENPEPVEYQRIRQEILKRHSREKFQEDVLHTFDRLLRKSPRR